MNHMSELEKKSRISIRASLNKNANNTLSAGKTAKGQWQKLFLSSKKRTTRQKGLAH